MGIRPRSKLEAPGKHHLGGAKTMERFARLRRRTPVDSSDAAHRIFASASDALFLLDPKGRVSAWSPGAEQTFGRPAGSLLGHPVTAIADGEWAERLPDLVRAALAGGRSAPHSIPVRRADGAELTVEVRLSVVRDASGEPTGVVAVARETGERDGREEELREREARLLDAARFTTAGEILDGLAHEVSQPLTSISNFAGACEILLRDLREPSIDPVRGHLQSIIEQATKGGDILRRARQFVRRSEEPVVFELGEAVRESLALLHSELTQRGVKVVFEPAEAVNVRAERREIEHVLVNLLRNACEAFTAKIQDPAIRIEIEREGDTAFVAVHDNGIGIRSEAETHGEAFRSTKPDGLGVGLGICRTILERHHGKLRVDPRPGGGTTARFSLPLPPRRGADA